LDVIIFWYVLPNFCSMDIPIILASKTGQSNCRQSAKVIVAQ
jgi:hypothetical protein